MISSRRFSASSCSSSASCLRRSSSRLARSISPRVLSWVLSTEETWALYSASVFLHRIENQKKLFVRSDTKSHYMVDASYVEALGWRKTNLKYKHITRRLIHFKCDCKVFNLEHGSIHERVYCHFVAYISLGFFFNEKPWSQIKRFQQIRSQ